MQKNEKIGNIRKALVNIGLYITPRLVLLIMGVYVKKQTFTEQDEAIYRKYLGEDITFENKPSIMVANHVSWVEVIYNVSLYGGFIAKEEMENVPVVGFIIKVCEGMFIARESKDSREKMLEDIQKRQNEYLNGNRNTCLMIYPEGTISKGTHLMPFKKGAFKAGLPVKPYLSLINKDSSFCDLSQTTIPALFHMFIFGCFLYNYYIFKSLPTIILTEFALKTNKVNNNEEPFETFMNTCYNIMKECGGFSKTNKGLKEFCDYTNKIDELKKKKKS